MAISTYKVFLMKGTAGSGSTVTYSKLLDIKDFGDLGGTPDTLETTTLSDRARTFIMGIDNTDAISFTANYTPDDFQTVRALEGTEQDFAIWFGGTESNGTVTPTGANGKFSFKGYVAAYVAGGGVNEVVNMGVTVTPSTTMAFSTGA